MGESRLRLPLVLFIGLVCGWLNVVGGFFGENRWREAEKLASCTELDGLTPMEWRRAREGRPVVRDSIAECVRMHVAEWVPMDQTSWAHVRAIHERGIRGTWNRGAALDRAAEQERAENASIGQRVWHDLFRVTSFLSFGNVGRQHLMLWDRIATATLSCLLAMLVVGVALRRFAPVRDPVVVV
jgi:hypothetical protein